MVSDAFRGGRQGDNAGDARVHRLGDAFDGAPLAGRIATFKNHHDLEALGFDLLLHFHQFNLQAGQLGLVFGIGYFFAGHRIIPQESWIVADLR